MKSISRILVALAALLFLAVGLEFWVAPRTGGAALRHRGDPRRRACVNLRADLGGLFIGLGTAVRARAPGRGAAPVSSAAAARARRGRRRPRRWAGWSTDASRSARASSRSSSVALAALIASPGASATPQRRGEARRRTAPLEDRAGDAGRARGRVGGSAPHAGGPAGDLRPRRHADVGAHQHRAAGGRRAARRDRRLLGAAAQRVPREGVRRGVRRRQVLGRRCRARSRWRTWCCGAFRCRRSAACC